MRKIFTGLIVLFISSFIYAQTGSIKGVVYEKSTGEPVPFCNVFLEGTTYGVATDIDGYFNLSKVKAGNYTFKVSYIGYTDYSEKITVQAGKILNKKVHLESSAVRLDDVIITAERQEQKTQVKASIVKITPKQITKIPTIGSEPDLAQYLQVVPGVVFTGDQGGQLYIRGGPPIQNKVLLDGMIVYNPFHSIGLFSVFDSDLIRNADIYTGGFNAEYGGRISSIMDISMRDGNKKRFSGKLSGSPFGAKLMVEGPFKKITPESSTSASYVFSGKTSYLEQSSKIFYDYIDTAGLPFNYTDLYGKVSLNTANGSRFNVFGFKFSDQVRYQAVSDLNWDAKGIGTNFIIVPSGAPVLVKMDFNYSDYGIALVEDPFVVGDIDRERSSSIKGFNGGIRLNYFLGDNELDAGLEISGFNTLFHFNNSLRYLEQEDNTTEFAAFMKYKLTVGKLIVEPGIRFQYYSSASKLFPEPRIGIKYNLLDFVRLKGAAGIYSQNLISATSDRDVVNLFYGFLSGPDELQDEFDGEPIVHNLQTSWHGIGGVEVDVTNRINLNVEGYYKKNMQLTNINRNKIFEDTPENYDKADYYKKDFLVEEGAAYGVDFLIKYDYKRVYLWFVYSLGYVTRYDGIVDYVPHFDRRHNVNFLATYTFGEDLNWEASARWNLGSGFPFTQTSGYYEKL
ncbi:MAG: TonB-dependent receptor, partial [Marinilabiliales bacterium]